MTREELHAQITVEFCRAHGHRGQPERAGCALGRSAADAALRVLDGLDKVDIMALCDNAPHRVIAPKWRER